MLLGLVNRLAMIITRNGTTVANGRSSVLMAALFIEARFTPSLSMISMSSRNRPLATRSQSYSYTTSSPPGTLRRSISLSFSSPSGLTLPVQNRATPPRCLVSVMRSPSVLALPRETSSGEAGRETVDRMTWLVRVRLGSFTMPELIFGMAIGRMRKKSRQNVNVIHAAEVVARRQYMPTQNTAAKSIGTIQVSCRLLNMS